MPDAPRSYAEGAERLRDASLWGPQSLPPSSDPSTGYVADSMASRGSARRLGRIWLSTALRIFVVSVLSIYPKSGVSSELTSKEWPTISAEELALKDNPASPGSSAIILYREITSDDVKSVETHYSRIKILTESGKKYADIQIPYLYKNTEIRDIRARTVQSDGKAVEFNGQIFDKLVVKTKRVKFQAKTFSLPEVRAGSIIEYSYSIHWRDKVPGLFRDPVKYYVRYSSTIPTAHWVIQSDLFTRRARFVLRPLPKARLTMDWGGLPQGVEPRKQTDGTVTLEAANVPAFEEEEFTPPQRVLKSRVDFYYSIGPVYPSVFWIDQSRLLAESLQEYLAESKAIAREAARLVSDHEAPETNLRKLYERAQQIRYLSYEPSKTQQEEKRQNLKDNKSVSDILKHGYGSANEINLLFVALARAAGFKAAPVMVADRRHNFFNSNVLDIDQLDAMVVWVRAGFKDYYHDPATRYCPFGLVPWFETDTTGLRVGGPPGLVQIPGGQSKEAVVERKGSFELDNEGNLQGKLHVRFTGQEALDRRLENNDSDEAGRRKALEDEVKGWLPAGSTVELQGVNAWDQSAESLDADFTLKIASFATATGRRLLFPSGLLQSNETQAFKSVKRLHPIYFAYPYREVDEINVRIPAGKKVEGLPNPRIQDEVYATYETTCKTKGETIELKRRLEIFRTYFDSGHYSVLRAFFSRVRSGDEQQVVLENVSTTQANQHN